MSNEDNIYNLNSKIAASYERLLKEKTGREDFSVVPGFGGKSGPCFTIFAFTDEAAARLFAILPKGMEGDVVIVNANRKIERGHSLGFERSLGK